MAGYRVGSPKFIIAVDEDIDARDADSVNWALCFRMQPHRDMKVAMGKAMILDPSLAPPTASPEEQRYPSPNGGSAVLMDATMKWPYPPTALPKKEFMEDAKKIWEELGLPPLEPKVPWYGYSLGQWTEEYEVEAELALKGDHYQTGEKMAQNRFKAR